VKFDVLSSSQQLAFIQTTATTAINNDNAAVKYCTGHMHTVLRMA